MEPVPTQATGPIVSAVAGIVFGLTLAAPPGPMNAIIAEESVLRGWGAGFRAGLGAAIADVTFFVLAALGVVGFVERVPVVRGVMVAVGGALMVYFAYGAARDAGFLGDGEATFLGVADGADDTASSDGSDAGGVAGTASVGGRSTAESAATTVSAGGAGEAVGGTGFRKAFVLALTNPYQILFWVTVGVGLLDPGQVDVFAGAGLDRLAGAFVVETGSPALLVGFFGGIGVWITGFPAALVGARRHVERLAPVVAGLSALALAGFGVAFLLDAANTLML